MAKKYVIFSLLAIMVLAVFFRFWQIKSIPPGLYPDEAMNGNNAIEALKTKNFKMFYPENNGREGLFINIQAISLAVFGNKPWALRIVSAIFGTLTVLGLYFLTKIMFKSERVALLASFFLATSFWHINFSRIGFRAILAPFFLVWSFYFLWKGFAKTKFFNPLSLKFSLRENFARPHLELKNLVFVSLSGLFFGLGFHTYIAYRLAPLLLIIPFILLWPARNATHSVAGGKAEQKKLIFIFLIFAFLAALPLGIYFLQNPQDFFGRTAQISIFSAASPVKEFGLNIAKTIGMFFWAGDYNWRHNLSGNPQLWWPIAIIFTLGFLLYCKNCLRGLAQIWCKLRSRVEKSNCLTPPWRGSFGFFVKRDDYNLPKLERLSEDNFCNEKTFLFIWLISMLIPTIISSEGLPHALRAIVIIPPVMIFAALGLEWIIVKISDWLRKKIEQCPQYLNQLNRIKKELVVLLFLFFIAVAGNAFNQYFLRWAPSPYVADAFSENYVELGNYLNTLPADIPKYVIVNANGAKVRDIPMPAQTAIFITKTYLPEWQKEKNIFYITLPQIDSLIQKANQQEHFYITILETDANLRLLLKEKISDLKTGVNKSVIFLYK